LKFSDLALLNSLMGTEGTLQVFTSSVCDDEEKQQKPEVYTKAP